MTALGVAPVESDPAIVAALARSLDLSHWVSDSFPSKFTTDGKNHYSVALLSIALDHRESMLLLLRHGARSAAFALARTVFEAYMRGAWVHHCATQDDVDRIERTGITPSFGKVVSALGRLPGLGKQFLRSRDLAWEALCDYTHGGARQLDRWTGPAGIAPTHDAPAVAELLDAVDSWAVLSTLLVWSITGLDTIRNLESASEQIGRISQRRVMDARERRPKK